MLDGWDGAVSALLVPGAAVGMSAPFATAARVASAVRSGAGRTELRGSEAAGITSRGDSVSSAVAF
jgi:hypothetical protein